MCAVKTSDEVHSEKTRDERMCSREMFRHILSTLLIFFHKLSFLITSSDTAMHVPFGNFIF